MKLTTQFLLVPKLRLCRVVPPLPPVAVFNYRDNAPLPPIRCFHIAVSHLPSANDVNLLVAPAVRLGSEVKTGAWLFWSYHDAEQLTNQLTPWSRVLLEKLTVPQLVKNSLHFMEPEGSSPHSQETATCAYPEPDHFLFHTSKLPPSVHRHHHSQHKLRILYIRRSSGSSFCDRKLGPLVPKLHQIQKDNSNTQAV